jgi:uncharacterized protein HemX
MGTNAKLVAAIVGVLVIGLAAGAYRLHVIKAEREDALNAMFDAETTRAKSEGLNRKLAARNEAVASARDAVLRATNESDRAAAQKALVAAVEEQRKAEIAATPGGVAPPAENAPGRIHCGCDAGDPNCSML